MRSVELDDFLFWFDIILSLQSRRSRRLLRCSCRRVFASSGRPRQYIRLCCIRLSWHISFLLGYSLRSGWGFLRRLES